jgi:hypothetical protein
MALARSESQELDKVRRRFTCIYTNPFDDVPIIRSSTGCSVSHRSQLSVVPTGRRQGSDVVDEANMLTATHAATRFW